MADEELTNFHSLDWEDIGALINDTQIDTDNKIATDASNTTTSTDEIATPMSSKSDSNICQPETVVDNTIENDPVMIELYMQEYYRQLYCLHLIAQNNALQQSYYALYNQFAATAVDNVRNTLLHTNSYQTDTISAINNSASTSPMQVVLNSNNSVETSLTEKYGAEIDLIKRNIPAVENLFQKQFDIPIDKIRRVRDKVQAVTAKNQRVQARQRKAKLLIEIVNGSLGKMSLQNRHANGKAEKAFENISKALQQNNLVKYFKSEKDYLLQHQILLTLVQVYFFGGYFFKSPDAFSKGTYYKLKLSEANSNAVILSSKANRMRIALKSKAFPSTSCLNFSTNIIVNDHPTACKIEGNNSSNRKHWIISFDTNFNSETPTVVLRVGSEIITIPNTTAQTAATASPSEFAVEEEDDTEQMEQDDAIDLNFSDDE